MRSICVKVLKKDGEETRILLSELINRELKIKSDATHLYIPVSGDSSVLKQFEVLEMEFEKARKRGKIEDILGFSPSFEIIGDIAITEHESVEVAKAILEIHRVIKTVLYSTTPVRGEYRLREFKVLAGETKTFTVYREYGSIFEVDLAKAYFTPRLSTERHRVVEQVKANEVAVDMFAGVGTFAIQIARKARRVYAIDKNPYAIKFLQRNLTLNRIVNLEVMQGDVREMASNLRGTADRIIMNLPHSAYDYLPEAMQIAGEKCIVHHYSIGHVDDLFQSAIEQIEKAANDSGRKVRIIDKRIVRPYAPYQFNICVDFSITQ